VDVAGRGGEALEESLGAGGCVVVGGNHGL
jgi:hypothetical protein